MVVVNLARAAASPLFRDRPASAPDVVLKETAVRADPDRVRAYAQVCGFESGPVMPATYPHVLAFDQMMRLMSRRDFPFALPGLIHVRNTITVHRPIETAEALTLRVHTGDVVEHPKGRTVDVLTSAGVGDTECWAERSTYLHREKARRRPADAPERAEPLPAVATWDLPGTLGRRYARVSNDWNPIHLSRWTARLFGYSRPIAHGMWTLGRALAATPLPVSFTVDATFIAPLTLPARVEFASDGRQAAVRPAGAPGARPHLTGTITRP